MENSNDSSGNRTADRPACSAVRQLVPQNPSVHYPNHISWLLDHKLSHLSLIQNRMSHLFKIHFNICFLFRPVSSK
jgi:hypothetical protein